MENRRLTAAAQADRDNFEALKFTDCCSCHINPPCDYCTHPGNPDNQQGNEFYLRMTMSDYDNLRPIFKRNVWLLRVSGVMMFVLFPLLYIPLSFPLLWDEHKELIGGWWDEVKMSLTIKRPND